MTIVLAGTAFGASTALVACGGGGGSKPAKAPAPTERLYHPVSPAGPLPRVRHLRPAN